MKVERKCLPHLDREIFESVTNRKLIEGNRIRKLNVCTTENLIDWTMQKDAVR